MDVSLYACLLACLLAFPQYRVQQKTDTGDGILETGVAAICVHDRKSYNYDNLFGLQPFAKLAYENKNAIPKKIKIIIFSMRKSCRMVPLALRPNANSYCTRAVNNAMPILRAEK